MASILDSKQEISDVVLFEDWKEYGLCRSKETVNVTAAFEIGTVCEDTVADNTYDGILAADVATLSADVVIVIDDAIYDGVTGDRSITVLKPDVNASCGVKIAGLKYLDTLTSGNKLTVQAALAAIGIKSFTTV